MKNEEMHLVAKALITEQRFDLGPELSQIDSLESVTFLDYNLSGHEMLTAVNQFPAGISYEV